MKRRVGILFLFLSLTFPVLGAVNTVDYFVLEAPGACMARDPVDLNTYLRIFPGSPNQCSGLQVYHRSTGGLGGNLSSPNQTESYYVLDGWIRIMNEIFYFPRTGVMKSYRAFRDQTDYWKGIRWLPTSFSTYLAWTPQPFVEEHWTNGQGQPVCFNTQQVTFAGSVSSSYVFLDSLPSWMQDRRSSSLDPNIWHSLDAIVRVDFWGGRNTEHYWYGRWQNPLTGQWEGLGLVKWRHYMLQGGQWKLLFAKDWRYLADCNYSVPCSTCPP